MKKIILTSTLGVVAVVAANAANINDMNGNVLYRPMEGLFYMTGDNYTNTDFEYFKMKGSVGYGITDDFSVYVNTSNSYDSSDNPRFDTKFNWDSMDIGMSMRYMNDMNWVGDFYAEAGQNLKSHDGLTTLNWNWKAGTNFGYTGIADMILSVNAEANAATGGLLVDNAWGMRFGMDAYYQIMDKIALIGALDYDFNLDNTYYANNPMTAKLGMSYDIENWGYVEAYGFKNVKEGFNTAPMGMGLAFGFEF